MTTTKKSTLRALWIPAWYELDQAVETGNRSRFWFYQNPPHDLPDYQSCDLIFFNQLCGAANCQVREATVESMEHAELGPLQRINTTGLDYQFQTVNGLLITVNAEENPGKDDQNLNIDNWSVNVLISDVSDPLVDA